MLRFSLIFLKRRQHKLKLLGIQSKRYHTGDLLTLPLLLTLAGESFEGAVRAGSGAGGGGALGGGSSPIGVGALRGDDEGKELSTGACGGAKEGAGVCFTCSPKSNPTFSLSSLCLWMRSWVS